ncbi:hypothetical protein B0I35DRAFT_482927 [Stachybotrys elegans]|uniref:O-methyltransferase C-terminal domain-containing protein n=1 Tax=Stachybotrys elegans TaxID=80388 RepID=A0A8K0SIU6_9HYPO|nr:hypothetical protein B0I35DRAFT_482927 [Stachybotrys elegans]
MPAYLALPQYLRDHNYQLPLDKADTPLALGHGLAPGETFFDFVRSNPKNAAYFNKFMKVHRTGVQTWLDKPEIMNKILQNSIRGNLASHDVPKFIFVDVGGGMGQQCKALLARYPTLSGRVMLQDLHEVVSKADVGKNVEIMAIDFFKSQPGHRRITCEAFYVTGRMLRAASFFSTSGVQ